MTTIMIGKALAAVTENETLTSGMIGAKVRFIFSGEWSGLTKTAIFKAGYTTKAVTQDQWDGNSCSIPSEVLNKAGEPLLVGLYGINASKKIATPTVWATVGAIRSGADPSADASTSDTLPVWAQVQETAENAKETAEAAKELAENAYVKPSGGIPDTDLTEEVNMALERGANSYVKPDTGIPENHLAQNVKDKINNAAAKADAALPKSGGTLTGTVQLIPGTTGFGVKFGDNLRVYGGNTNLQIEGSENGVLWGSVTITGIATPTQNNGVANKEYVDAAVASIQTGSVETVHYYTNDSFEENMLSILYGVIYYDSNSGSGVADLTYNSLCVKFLNATPFTLRVDDPENSTSAYLIFDYLGADSLYGHFFDSSGMRRFKATTSGIVEIQT